MSDLTREQVPVRLLVVDAKPEVIEDYRYLLCGQTSESAGQQSGSLTEGLFAAVNDPHRFPSFELVACDRIHESLDAVDQALEQQAPFAVAFIEIDEGPPFGNIRALEDLRALDPDIQLVVVTGDCRITPAELMERVPPADKLFFLQKPFHAFEVQQLAVALSAKWRSERARGDDLRVDRGAPSRTQADPGEAMERLPAGVVVFDRHDRLVSSNRNIARLFPELADFFLPGTRYEEILWQMAQRLLPEDTLFRVETWVRDRLDWHGKSGGVLEQRLRGGRWVFMAEARTEDRETYCQFFDITDLKRRDSSRWTAIRLTQMAQSFAALCEQLHINRLDVEHQSDSGKVVSLRAGKDDDGERAEPARLAPGNIQDLTFKLQTIAQRQRLKPDSLDLNLVVEEVVRTLDPYDKSKHKLEVIAGAGLWQVLLDKGQLSIALAELLGNAFDAMDEGGLMVVETANVRLTKDFVSVRSGLVQADHVRLTVKDNGPGMSPELAERAFNPFFTSRPDGRHLGLGLSMVYGFVSQSGGYIEIRDSETPGTTIDIYFPRAEASSGRSDVVQRSEGS
ncbi:MAG: ATP-binding protein [Pseudomonadota bacterium]